MGLLDKVLPVSRNLTANMQDHDVAPGQHAGAAEARARAAGLGDKAIRKCREHGAKLDAYREQSGGFFPLDMVRVSDPEPEVG